MRVCTSSSVGLRHYTKRVLLPTFGVSALRRRGIGVMEQRGRVIQGLSFLQVLIPTRRPRSALMMMQMTPVLLMHVLS